MRVSERPLCRFAANAGYGHGHNRALRGGTSLAPRRCAPKSGASIERQTYSRYLTRPAVTSDRSVLAPFFFVRPPSAGFVRNENTSAGEPRPLRKGHPGFVRRMPMRKSRGCPTRLAISPSIRLFRFCDTQRAQVGCCGAAYRELQRKSSRDGPLRTWLSRCPSSTPTSGRSGA